MAQPNDDRVWATFYRKLAETISGKYNNKNERPQDLLNDVLKIYGSDTSETLNAIKDHGIGIDPFSAFQLFSHNRLQRKRITVLKKFNDGFELNTEIPQNFDSLPKLPMNNWPCFCRYKRFKGTEPSTVKDVTTLWKLFETALDYANLPSDASKETVNKARKAMEEPFNEAVAITGNGTKKITMGLSWIAPNVFLSISDGVWEYICSEKIPAEYRISEDMLTGDGKSKISAKDYFAIMDKLTPYLRSKGTDFIAIGLDTYSEKPDSRDQSDMDQSDNLNEEDPDHNQAEEQTNNAPEVPDDSQVNESEETHPSTEPGVPKKYWWLNADDGIKDFSEIPVGETEDINLLNNDGNERLKQSNFLDAKVGDVVVVYQSQKTIAVCEISAGVHKNDSGNEQIQVRKVDNLVSPIDCAVDIATLNEIPDLGNEEPFQKAPSEQDKFAVKRGTLFKLTKHGYHSIMTLVLRKKFLAEVFMGKDQYEKLVRLLKNKKNIILQGPPGVGKTFAARRLAWSMTGDIDEDRIKLVQFHQNYSYEDFVEGYKPRNKKDPEEAKEEGEFVLRKGTFYEFCKKARGKEEPYFFIIDEINRGNMSKIFGELLMLIEKDYRGDKYSLELAYSREKFSVPENLYIIGMMNTADRSLAMLDYALRRRFAFVDMKPAFDSEGFKKHQEELLGKCQDENERKIFGKLIEWVNKKLNKEIREDESLGEGFCIGHSYFCGWEECTEAKMRDVLECDIIPTLKEYWFDNPKKLQDWTGDGKEMPDDLKNLLDIKKKSQSESVQN